jgi:hypothetical protein
MVQTELMAFSRMVEHIKQLCVQGKSGTLFLVSDQNQMVQVHLARGEIVSLAHRNRRGLEALAVLVTMKNAKLRLDEGYVASPDGSNLATKVILDHLDNVASVASVAAAPVAASGASVPTMLGPEIRATAQRILMKYVGPMAEIVCADHFERTTDLRALARSLSNEIPDQAQAMKFAAEISAAFNLAPA